MGENVFYNNAWIFRIIFQFAQMKGISEEEILILLQCDRQQLDNKNSFFNYDFIDRIVLFLLSRSNNTFLGIELGGSMNMLSGHILEPLLRSCENVFDAVKKLEAYNTALSNFITIKSLETKSQFHVYITASEAWVKQYPLSSRIVRDFIIKYLESFIFEISNNSVRPVKIGICNPDLIHHSEINVSNLFFKGAVIALSADFDYIIYNSSDNTMLLSRNKQLLQLLESEINRYPLEEYNSPKISSKIKEQLLSFENKLLFCNVGYIAKFNNMSVRKLQQKLQEEGTNFRTILNEVKFLLIQKQLADPAVSIKIISDDLGYSNVSSLHGLFKKKLGISVRKYFINSKK